MGFRGSLRGSVPSESDGRPIEEVWSQLLDAGVDLLSVDDVSAYRDFLVKTGRND